MEKQRGAWVWPSTSSPAAAEPASPPASAAATSPAAPAAAPPPPPKAARRLQTWQQLASGAVAGAAGKSLLAPVDRIRILYQVGANTRRAL